MTGFDIMISVDFFCSKEMSLIRFVVLRVIYMVVSCVQR